MYANGVDGRGGVKGVDLETQIKLKQVVICEDTLGILRSSILAKHQTFERCAPWSGDLGQ